MKVKKTVADYPEVAKQWHPIKNKEMTAENTTFGTNKKAWWICEKGHEWEAAILPRTTRKVGCPFCAGRKPSLVKKTVADYPEVAAQWHPIKNGEKKPEKTKFGSDKKAWWICEKGHEWEAAITNRTRLGHGCPFCSGASLAPERALNLTHPDLILQWDYAKNGNAKPNDFSAGSDKLIHWKCEVAEDHKWEATIDSRTGRSRGCPCCSGNKVVLSNCLATTQPEIAAQWDSTKNEPLTPKDVTAGSHKIAWWKCSKNSNHPSWSTMINQRTSRGHGCPMCSASKGEAKIQKYLRDNRINHKPEWKPPKNNVLGNRKAFDFAVKRNDRFCLIEYHGQQHYVPVNFGSRNPQAGDENLDGNLRRDKIKRDWCENTNRPLLEIPYWDFDRIDEILDDWFAGKEPIFSEPPPEVKKYEEHRQKILDRLRAKGEIE